MGENAQGSLEYLLLIGGALIVAAVVIALAMSVMSSANTSVNNASNKATEVLESSLEKLDEVTGADEGSGSDESSGGGGGGGGDSGGGGGGGGDSGGGASGNYIVTLNAASYSTNLCLTTNPQEIIVRAYIDGSEIGNIKIWSNNTTLQDYTLEIPETQVNEGTHSFLIKMDSGRCTDIDPLHPSIKQIKIMKISISSTNSGSVQWQRYGAIFSGGELIGIGWTNWNNGLEIMACSSNCIRTAPETPLNFY